MILLRVRVEWNKNILRQLSETSFWVTETQKANTSE